MFDDEVLDTEVESIEEVDETVDEVEETDEAENEQESGEPVDDTEEKPVQSKEDNARYADMRRKAEAAAQAKYQQQLDAMNERFKTAFAKYGVESAEDYLEKYEAQQRKTVDAQLEKAGIDVNQVMNAMQNTPEIRQLKKQADELARADRERKDAEDFKIIQKLDPSITEWGDIVKKDINREYYKLVFEKNYDKVSAYKIAFFDELMANKAAATKQAAVNAARSKSHMRTTDGNASAGSDMTDADLEIWRQFGFKPSDAKKYKTKFDKEK